MGFENNETIEIVCPICSEKIQMDLSSNFCICDVCHTRIELDAKRLEQLRKTSNEDSNDNYSKNINVNFSI